MLVNPDARRGIGPSEWRAGLLARSRRAPRATPRRESVAVSSTLDELLESWPGPGSLRTLAAVLAHTSNTIRTKE